MSLFIASLNSGSNANAYYVGDREGGVLIDAGLSCREMAKRLARLQLDMGHIRAIFISHEHADHIAGLSGICKKYPLPVYLPSGTQLVRTFAGPDYPVFHYDSSNPTMIGSLEVNAFVKHHDAAHPHSFTISGHGVTVGVFTDIGRVCDNLIQRFKQCHAAILEANYDTDMLVKGGYPWHLKQRITGGLGHLSNKEALNLFTTHRPPFMRHLILGHLSKNNNCPQLVADLFAPVAGHTNVVVASRYEQSALYEIAAGDSRVLQQYVRPVQMELF